MRTYTGEPADSPEKRDKEKTVIRYYDRNTKRFLSLGQGGSVSAIHRAVWAPEVTNREEGMHYVHDLIVKNALQLQPELVVDLGCGIGGSMLYLASRCKARFYGVTISRIQAAAGALLIREKEMDRRVVIEQRSYLDSSLYSLLEKNRGSGACLFYGIESFLHTPSSEELLDHLGGFCRAGDVLIVCDDFLSVEWGEGPRGKPKTGGERTVSRKAVRMVSRFRRNWKAHGLISAKQLILLAGRYGFQLKENRNLTGFLELGRVRDKIIRFAVFFLVVLPFRPSWLENMIGGDALQYLLKRGTVEYRYLVFNKAPSQTHRHSC
jgi:SAM-dependent methyltransferase